MLVPLFVVKSEHDELIEKDPKLSNINAETQAIPSLSTVCQLHDNLVECLQETRGTSDGILAKTSEEVSQSWFSCERASDTDLIRRFILEADLYRAIQVISHYLLGKLPKNLEGIHCLRNKLQTTMQKAKILIKLLSSIYSFFIARSTELSSLPTNYPVLQHWLDEQEEAQHPNNIFSNEQNGTNGDEGLTFDKEALVQEEVELMRMAFTPTPLEAFGTTNLGGSNCKVSQDDQEINQEPENLTDTSFPLLARLETNSVKSSIAGDAVSTPVAMHRCGIIRARDDSGACWALTATSKIECKPPIVTITSVLSNHERNTSSLSLQVGSSSRQWWDETSKVIKTLQEIQELRAAAAALWIGDINQSKEVLN